MNQLLNYNLSRSGHHKPQKSRYVFFIILFYDNHMLPLFFVKLDTGRHDNAINFRFLAHTLNFKSEF